MKRTHLSTGIYHIQRHALIGRRQREKHNTLCGAVCDLTKATTAREAVTCQKCRKRMGTP